MFKLSHLGEGIASVFGWRKRVHCDYRSLHILKAVEAILGHRLRSGETEYLVKFAGFTNRYNLWLPLVNLSNSEDIVRAYHASLALQGFQRTENP